VLHAARRKYMTQKVSKTSPSGHIRTTLSGYIFANKAHVDNRNKSSAVAEMGDRLVTIGMGRKWGGAPVGGWVPILRNVAWAEAYLFTKWHL